MWRMAAPTDDESIIRMCLALYAEDPGLWPLPPDSMRRTLGALRDEPLRGRAVVLERDGRIGGYALIISYWSNELGGHLDVIDELYVDADLRGAGHATRLIEALAAGAASLGANAIALALEVTPDNVRARRLYERLGFQGKNLSLRRPLVRRVGDQERSP